MEGPDREWLEAGGVEVWLATPSAAAVAAATPWLAAVEHARARRLRVPEARARFVVGRGLARQGLARLAGLEPQAVPLQELPSGKPAVALPQPRFNIAHSGDLVLAAFAWGREVGVDVEAIRPRAELRLAERHFRAEEVAAIAAVTGEARTRLFARCWTRKEALLKATGAAALLVGLASLERPFALGPEWEAYEYRGRTWAVGDVALPTSHHAAAVAVEGSTLRLRVHAWEP